MQFTDIRVDRFGTLINTAAESLSPRVTVFFGSCGTGKTAFVRFIRGLLHGYRRTSSAPLSELQTESGSARVRSEGALRTLHRSWNASGVEQFTVRDEIDRISLVRQDNHLPNWVTDDVFREVFSPGYEEADRFDLLTRLCIECGTVTGVPDVELRQAEAALLQAVRDRDGNGVQGGVVHRISELRRRQGELQGEISLLRKPSADVSGRIEQLVREIEELTASMQRMDLRLREIDAEIARLEQLLADLRRRNVLPLNRQKLEEEIRVVTGKLERWRDIRTLVVREAEVRRIGSDSTLRAEESLRSVRAIVSRLEERSQTLTDRLKDSTRSEVESVRDADVIRQLRGEIAALCQYFGHHERSTAKHLDSLQAMLAERTLADATQMESLLSEQLICLNAELARAGNILEDKAVPALTEACRFSGHQGSLSHVVTNRGEYQTAADVEAQIGRLRAERARLLTERTAAEETRGIRRTLLEKLRLEMAGAASLEQLDGLRSQIAQLDAEISLLEDQRRQLDRTEASLREVIERLKARTVSQVFELASKHVRLLTCGECLQIEGVHPDRLQILTSSSSVPVSLSSLSRETRDQIGLALRLALLEVREQKHGHVPLILDDVLIASDPLRASAAAELLTRVAESGQQIIIFTSRKDVFDLFARHHADVRSFASRMEMPAPPVPVALHAYVEPRPEPKPVVMEPIVYLQPAPAAPPAVEPDSLNSTNWLFYLEVDHGVEDLAGITLGELEALRAAGILTVDDLLQRTVPQLEEMTRHKGFVMSVDRLHALRGQAELTTRVPMLRRGDAALLFAAGIRSVEELSRLRPETVYDRVSEFQRSEAGSRFRRGGRLIDRQQSINWARFGQFARSLEDARSSRSRFAVRQTPRSLAPLAPAASVSSAVRHSAAEADPLKRRRRRRLAESQQTEERRARRQARRLRQASRLRTEASDATTDDSVPAERSGGMRFFLSRTSEVEKAPSIGPRTAKMMESIGVRTVEDFLSMSPDRLSEKLSHRRITPAVIQQWQAQARLMCQIPELRGHDAQILVACHIITPESLAAQKPAELFAVVEPFTRTKEGERIIRTGRKPDLAEVTEWIQWAANARSLRAA